MKTYILTKETLAGNVIFGYTPTGLLVFFDASPADLTDDKLALVLRTLPREEKDLQVLADKTGATLELIVDDISFDAFWLKYDKKINKKRVEPMYKKLSDAKKLLVIQSLPSYDAYLERTNFRGKADPETYLRKEMYLNDWSKER